MPALHNAEGGRQGFVHFKQAVCHPNGVPSPGYSHFDDYYSSHIQVVIQFCHLYAPS